MPLKDASGKMLAWIKPNLGRNRRIKRLVTVLGVARHYCANSTLHGLRYLVHPELHVIERLLWTAIFVAHAVVAVWSVLYLTYKVQVIFFTFGFYEEFSSTIICGGYIAL